MRCLLVVRNKSFHSFFSWGRFSIGKSRPFDAEKCSKHFCYGLLDRFFGLLFVLNLLCISFCLIADDVSCEPIRFVVVIPSYNNCKCCEANLESVFCQTYKNWTIYYVDDCSTDKTAEIVERYVDSKGMRDKCRIVHNKVRVGAMENLYNAIHAADPRSVIVDLDGDDLLAHPDVFQEVATLYKDPEVWLTYGSYVYEPGGQRGICRPLPEEVLANASVRSYMKWVTSQLRTFYARLFQLINKEDLMKDGKFFEVASDVALMLPMLEMASPNHIRYIDKINYIYNYTNPLSDMNRRELQLATDLYIRSLPPYKPLAKLFSDEKPAVSACEVKT